MFFVIKTGNTKLSSSGLLCKMAFISAASKWLKIEIGKRQSCRKVQTKIPYIIYDCEQCERNGTVILHFISHL